MLGRGRPAEHGVPAAEAAGHRHLGAAAVASVNDTETLLSAASWSATASEFDEDEDLDDETAAWLDAEDVLIDRLYQAPRSARGDTQLRAKKLQARLQPLKREARPMRGSR